MHSIFYLFYYIRTIKTNVKLRETSMIFSVVLSGNNEDECEFLQFIQKNFK